MSETELEPTSETQWAVFEVFHQQVRGEPHVHVGSIHAPDPEVALILAKEQYGRRQACTSLWVVRAEAISATRYEDVDIFEHATDKSYREAYGYETTKRAREASMRIRAQTTKRPRSLRPTEDS